VLGLLGVHSAWTELRYIFQPRPTPMAWFYKHMENMLGVGIGFHTAFLVFGAFRFLPFRLEGGWQLVPWLLPSLIGIPATHWWIHTYKRRFGEQEPGKTADRTESEVPSANGST
jgi:hypothetical protein